MSLIVHASTVANKNPPIKVCINLNKKNKKKLNSIQFNTFILPGYHIQ